MDIATEQIAEISRANFDHALKIAALALDKADRLAKLNLQSAKVALEQGAQSASAIAGVNDLEGLFALRAKLAETGVQYATAYSKGFYEVASETQADFSALMQHAWTAYATGIDAWVEKAAKDAPASSDFVVTALKSEAEQELRETKDRLDSILSSLRDVVWSMSRDGQTVLYVNSAAEELYRRPINEFYESPGLCLEVIHPDDREKVLRQWASVAQGEGVDMEYRIVWPDSSIRWLHDRRRPVHDENGTITRIDGLARDITDRKQHETRIKLDLEEKEILLKEIHHRVKNNLQVVRSLLELQSARIKDDAVLDMLLDSQNRITSMALVHETLCQSRNLARVDFGNFLDSLVPSLVASYGVCPENISVDIDAVGMLLPVDAAIPCGLVVNELITNALKHAFPGGQLGEIKVGLAHASNDELVLSVSDNGVGMPEAFDLDKAGTLGLQLVNLLIDQLGGTVTINRSKPTRFVLRFPLQE